MINVLINAYAVSPSWGSEPGMGWNWIINIAKYCNVYVITEGEWKEEILKAIKKLPQKDNLHFYFNPVSKKVRKMCWNQGDWRFYWYYKKWQKRTLKIAQEIISQNKIDILHQLNMIGFREPGYLWKIKDIPLVWGPIGGMNNIPVAFLQDAPLNIRVFTRLKNQLNHIQLKYSPRIRKAIKSSSSLITATPDNQLVIEKEYRKHSIFINETGLDSVPYKRNRTFLANGILKIIWVGKFDFRKRLDIAIKSIANADNPNIILYVCGEGSEHQKRQAIDLCKHLSIEDKVIFLGKIPHERILDLMRSCDLLLFTSIGDATSTVITEAISIGLPILSHDICGFGPIVKEYGGWAIEAKCSDYSIHEFGRRLNKLQQDPSELIQKKEKSIQNRNILSWDGKARKILEIYTSLLKKK